MERDFSVVFLENDSRKSFLPQGFLSCVVTKRSDQQQTRRFIYCLHCTKLKSLAWFYRHKKKYNVVPSPEVSYFKTNLFHYQQDIGTELDLLYDNGKLFVQQHEEPSHVVPSTQSSSRTVQGRSLSEEPSLNQLGVGGDDINCGGEAEEDDLEKDESINIKRTVDSICDCFSISFMILPSTLIVSLSRRKSFSGLNNVRQLMTILLTKSNPKSSLNFS